MLPPQFQHQSDYSDSSISTPPSYNFTPQSNDNNNSNDINPFVSITEEPGSNGLYQVQHLDGTQAQHFVELGVPFNFNGQQASLEQEEVMSPNGIMKKINMILLENAAASEMEGGGGVEDDIMGYSMSQSGFNTQYNNQQQPQNNSHQHNSHQLPKHQPPPPTLSLHFGGSNQQQLQHIGNDFPLMTPTTIIRHMLQEANNPNSFLQNPQQQMQSQSQAGGGLFESNINTSVPSPQQEFDAIMAFNSPTEEESPTRMFTNL